MGIRSSGMHIRSRDKLSRPSGSRGTVDIRRSLQTFSVNDKVLIDPDPFIQRNIPHRRFFGVSGVVLQKKGRSYTIGVLIGKKLKRLDLMPAHLKRL